MSQKIAHRAMTGHCLDTPMARHAWEIPYQLRRDDGWQERTVGE